MGVFGSINTAVSGLRAQAFALENISGNIANSQTTGFKRQDTSFFELVSDGAATQAAQNSGSVRAASRATNDIQGNIVDSDEQTFIAINGDGYFAVEQATGFGNGVPEFGGPQFFTRAGDFQLSNDDFLQNGSGFFLQGFSLISDSVNTSDPTGSAPIQISRDPLAPVPTDEIEFRAILPVSPATALANPDVPDSELLDPALRGQGGDPISQGLSTITLDDLDSFLNTTIPGGTSSVLAPRGTPSNVEFRFAKTENDAVAQPLVPGTATIDLGSVAGEFDQATIAATDTLDITLSVGGPLNITFAGATATPVDLANAINLAATGAGVDLTADGSSGDLVLSSDTADITGFTFTDVAGAGADNFTGAGTAGAFDANFSAAVDETFDTYNLYYRSDSTSSLENGDLGTTGVFQRVDQQFQFGPDGELNPATTPTTITDFTINGVNIGDVTINNGFDGFTQIESRGAGGQVSNAVISSNGSSLGLFQGVSVNDGGLVSVSYSNGATVNVAEINVVTFDNDAGLQRVDGGGTFAQTASSGSPSRGSNTVIVGGALESSNTDIADEFTKLIITQQAYTANSRVITTGDELLSETINIIR